MGFFKEFKEDFSDAIDEMIPGGVEEDKEEDVMVNTIDEEIDVDTELSKLDGLLEKASMKAEEPARTVEQSIASAASVKPVEAPKTYEERHFEERVKMDTTPIQTMTNDTNVTDETTVITSGSTLTGDLASSGSIQVQGTINGNVSCNGKLEVTGVIKGNSVSAELFADAAKIEGEVKTTGTAKIGAGTIVIGNISASSAVIAGAVKGDIDVEGPVVVDTSAVVMGNIKSRSVQINNGAVIEGYCSQSYAEVDVQSVFEA